MLKALLIAAGILAGSIFTASQASAEPSWYCQQHPRDCRNQYSGPLQPTWRIPDYWGPASGQTPMCDPSGRSCGGGIFPKY